MKDQIVKYKHHRTQRNIEYCDSMSFVGKTKTRVELSEETFGGEIFFTPAGIIVSEFDGEHQYVLIQNGDQSGHGDSLVVEIPVDSPIKVNHVMVEGRTHQNVLDGVKKDKSALYDETTRFLSMISPEALEIITSRKENWIIEW